MKRINARIISLFMSVMLLMSVSTVYAVGTTTANTKDTSITSSIYKIDSTKATIELPLKPIDIVSFKSSIKTAKGAVVTILKADGKTVVTKGSLEPGMKVKIVAPDKKTAKIFTVNRFALKKWTVGGPAMPGSFADAEVIDLGNGTYRMYYCIESHVPGNKSEMYSAISTDGKKWTKEEGVRRIRSVFPDIVKLPDGTWRMYFANAMGIGSCTSKDGLVWKDDEGFRIDTSNGLGLEFESVAAPSTTLLDDGTYIMVYSGSIKKKYKQDVPNDSTTILMWAASKDGINFEKKGVALDSRNDKFLGHIDGPEFYKEKDGSIGLYFWSYMGIYSSVYKNGTFAEPVLEYTTINEVDLRKVFPYPFPPPSDPALIKIGDTLFMYHGFHPHGIKYVTTKL